MSFVLASSSGSFNKKRCAMEFGTEWGVGKIFDWYRKNLTSRTINKLEIRITTDAIPHRFIVAYMQDGSICRFDRRPQTPQSAFIPIGPQGADEEPSCRAADEACLVTKADLTEIELSTNWEIRLDLPAEADVLLIISACFAIAQDKKARNYTLREYNCYFFSWTVVMLMTRHLLPFTVPSPTAVESRITARLAKTSATVGDRMVEILLHMSLSAVAAFDTVTGKRLNKGLSKQELAVWGLPAPVFRGLLRQCFKIQLRSGLRRKLYEQVHSQLEARMVSVFRTILEARTAGNDGTREHIKVADVVENRLWLNQLLEDLRQPIQEAILEVLWDNILDGISQGYDDVPADEVDQGFHRLSLLQRLKYRLLGKNVIQFSQIWNEAIRAALPAARRAGYGQYRSGMSHGDMLDLTFRAGVAAALEACQNVVRRTGPELADPKRDEMWEYIWTVWDDIWERVLVDTRNKALSLIENTSEDLVGWVAEDVVKELGGNERQKVQATIRLKGRGNLRLQGERAGLSLEVFQQQIGKFIQSVPGQTPERRNIIEEAMSNAWDVSRKTYKRVSPTTP
ncbi:hypothetical protein FRC08_004662 [Ceratobasidium sp. 394]|nr:hypothetical protein FRC08_004662 [Ceratobasidium sp. 394]KAG9079701.1 hypothetical protein FS749_008298 [Ceratobasidium sp. UAMH 11750]